MIQHRERSQRNAIQERTDEARATFDVRGVLPSVETADRGAAAETSDQGGAVELTGGDTAAVDQGVPQSNSTDASIRSRAGSEHLQRFRSKLALGEVK